MQPLEPGRYVFSGAGLDRVGPPPPRTCRRANSDPGPYFPPHLLTTELQGLMLDRPDLFSHLPATDCISKKTAVALTLALRAYTELRRDFDELCENKENKPSEPIPSPQPQSFTKLFSPPSPVFPPPSPLWTPPSQSLLLDSESFDPVFDGLAFTEDIFRMSPP